jgi:2-iminobutanoate/2-iminopropanoate deaminase
MTALLLAASLGSAQAESPNGVRTLEPAGAIKAEGTWSLGARAGDFIFVAGMQGIDPATNKLVEDPQARIRRAFLLNIKTIAESEGASLKDCVRLTVYLSDLPRFAPMVGASRIVGRAALSAPNHDRGEAPIQRRYRGDRQRLLRTSEKVRQSL